MDDSIDPIALRAFFENDRFAMNLGIHIEEIAAGRAVCTLQLISDHMNADHAAQGGVLFTLADFTFALAANCSGMGAVTLQSSISYFRPGREGSTLRAVAEAVNDGKRICVYQVQISDETGALIAAMTGTGYRKQPKQR